jgi:hypothetical protein
MLAKIRGVAVMKPVALEWRFFTTRQESLFQVAKMKKRFSWEAMYSSA